VARLNGYHTEAGRGKSFEGGKQLRGKGKEGQGFWRRRKMRRCKGGGVFLGRERFPEAAKKRLEPVGPRTISMARRASSWIKLISLKEPVGGP